MSLIIIYHNPRCSKSRQTLDLLNERNIKLTIKEYLNETLTVVELQDIVEKLGIKAQDLLRKNEEEYKNLSIDLNNDIEVFEAMIKFPKIIERPIVVTQSHAALGRPPENVLSIL